MSDEVLLERRGRILIITINRPEARNAVNRAVSQQLADAMDELDGNPELSVGIVTGTGGNFSAGMDLKAFAAGEIAAVEGRGLGFTEKPPKKPLIAAVEGNAWPGEPRSFSPPTWSSRRRARSSVYRRSNEVLSPAVAVSCGYPTESHTRRPSSWP